MLRRFLKRGNVETSVDITSFHRYNMILEVSEYIRIGQKKWVIVIAILLICAALYALVWWIYFETVCKTRIPNDLAGFTIEEIKDGATYYSAPCEVMNYLHTLYTPYFGNFHCRLILASSINMIQEGDDAEAKIIQTMSGSDQKYACNCQRCLICVQHRVLLFDTIVIQQL